MKMKWTFSCFSWRRVPVEQWYGVIPPLEKNERKKLDFYSDLNEVPVEMWSDIISLEELDENEEFEMCPETPWESDEFRTDNGNVFDRMENEAKHRRRMSDIEFDILSLLPRPKK